MALQKLFYISLFLLVCTAKEINPETEALLRWKSTLTPANLLSSWSISNPTCSWFGVTCNAAGHVTELCLPIAGLHGTLHAFYSPVLQNLTVLDLSANHLGGVVPANISLFRTLTVLSSLNLMFLSSLNLSNNRLSGEIPRGSQLQTLDDPSIYSNNVGLCGSPLSIACTNNSGTTTPVDGAKEHRHELETLWLYYSVIAGTVFGFWVWFGALFFFKMWRFAFFSCIDALHQKFILKMKGT